MTKIIITTDFSKDSKYTLEYVLNFMSKTQMPCKLLLLNTFMVQETDPKQVILLNDELKKKSKEGLERERAEALDKNPNPNPNITIELNSQMGSLKNVVRSLLLNDKFDLVAMGKDGGKHVEQIAALLKQIRCPLLITYHE